MGFLSRTVRERIPVRIGARRDSLASAGSQPMTDHTALIDRANGFRGSRPHRHQNLDTGVKYGSNSPAVKSRTFGPQLQHVAHYKDSPTVLPQVPRD